MHEEFIPIRISLPIREFCDECGAIECKDHRKTMEWISVKDRMPPINTSCRVKNDYHEDEALFLEWKEGYYFCIGMETKQTWLPTHWMPLPEPPNEMKERKDYIPNEGHHCKKGDFTCFRFKGDSELTLDVPKHIQVTVLVCPFCGEYQ